MCAKVISISSTCWATYNNQKTKKFTSSIHFNHYFWLTGEFQICMYVCMYMYIPD